MAKMGFDWLAIDMEHSVISLEQAQNMICAIRGAGCIPLVRVPSNDPVIIKRVMDAGSTGVIVPMVNSAEDARKCVEAAYYPPFGKRGVGLARAQGYGFSFEEYRDNLQKEAVVIVQIEHIDAVKNIGAILSVKGVDGFLIGPYDISGSIGKPGEFDSGEMKSALSKTLAAAKSANALSGYHCVQPDAEKCIGLIKSGYRFIGYSLDTLLLGSACRIGIESIHEFTRKKL
ncbi:2,4-dihydroxyhept-2-ene-1,7-dioic acid aldolase [Candidatus Woesearchaeota archaeon]|nr:2,4-dihydroxyhept-2-ene-1,7-dioic acid aldolase [Candidatus Woesearchaeota archaeon]